MNNPEDHEMAQHDDTDQFSPSFHYRPVPDEQVRAHLAEIFDAVESMDAAELDELVAEADQVDADRSARRMVLPGAPLRVPADWIETIQISGEQLGRLVDQMRLKPFDRIPNSIVVPKPTDRLLPNCDFTPAEPPTISIQLPISEGDAISRDWKAHGTPTAEQILYAEVCRLLTTGEAAAEADAIRADAQRDAAKIRADAQEEVDSMRAAAVKELAEARIEAARIRSRAIADAEVTLRKADAEKRKAEHEISRQREEVTQLIHSMNATTRTVRRTAEEVLTVLIRGTQWTQQSDSRRQWTLLPDDYTSCVVSTFSRTSQQPAFGFDPLNTGARSDLDVQLILLSCLGFVPESAQARTLWPACDYGDTAYRIFSRMVRRTLWGPAQEIGTSGHLSYLSTRREQIARCHHAYLELLRRERPRCANAEAIRQWLLPSQLIVGSDQHCISAELLEVPNPGKVDKALPAPKSAALQALPAGVNDAAEDEPDLTENEVDVVSPQPWLNTPAAIREWTAVSADLSNLRDELAKLVALPDQLDVEIHT